jgi:hypothetical protein
MKSGKGEFSGSGRLDAIVREFPVAVGASARVGTNAACRDRRDGHR